MEDTSRHPVSPIVLPRTWKHMPEWMAESNFPKRLAFSFLHWKQIFSPCNTYDQVLSFDNFIHLYKYLIMLSHTPKFPTSILALPSGSCCILFWGFWGFLFVCLFFERELSCNSFSLTKVNWIGSVHWSMVGSLASPELNEGNEFSALWIYW